MISENVILLRPLWVPHSFVKEENCRQTIKEWLIDGNYYINTQSSNFSIFVQSPDEIKRALSLDAFRFAQHSAQTVYELEKTNAYTKFTSWRIIKLYYAAFFAAHSVLRFFGKSFSHLEYGHTNFVSERAKTEAGYDPNLNSSYYLLSFDYLNQNILFKNYKKSHQDLWKCFSELLYKISIDVLSVRASENRREAFSQTLSVILDMLRDRGRCNSGNWLSVVRNEVNYKSMRDAWFPFSKTTLTFDDLMGKTNKWRDGRCDFSHPNLAKTEMEKFFITAFFIIDLAISICIDFNDISKISGIRSGNFFRLLHDSKVP